MIPSCNMFLLQAMSENVLSELNLLNMLLMYLCACIYRFAIFSYNRDSNPEAKTLKLCKKCNDRSKL